MSKRVNWDEIDLTDLYWNKGLALREIGEMFGVTEPSVLNAMKVKRIPRRTISVTNENRRSLKTLEPKALRDLYWEKKLSTNEISRILNASSGVILNEMKRFNIPRRTGSEASKLAYETGRKIKKHSPNYKGGRSMSNGYMRIKMPGHNRANSADYVAEHIYIWEQVHNRPLPQGWVIHHLNGIRNDNRPENLVAMPRGGHTKREEAEPYKKRIRELEARVKLLERALDQNQLIFNIGEN